MAVLLFGQDPIRKYCSRFTGRLCAANQEIHLLCTSAQAFHHHHFHAIGRASEGCRTGSEYCLIKTQQLTQEPIMQLLLQGLGSIVSDAADTSLTATGRFLAGISAVIPPPQPLKSFSVTNHDSSRTSPEDSVGFTGVFGGGHDREAFKRCIRFQDGRTRSLPKLQEKGTRMKVTLLQNRGSARTLVGKMGLRLPWWVEGNRGRIHPCTKQNRHRGTIKYLPIVLGQP